MNSSKKVKLLFLGSGAAFTVGGNYQSNMIVEIGGKKLLIDCGSDIRLSLYEQSLSHKDINAVFVSHLHADHVGGLEWLAFKTKFDKECQKPHLYVSKNLKDLLWNHVLCGGLSSIEECQASLDLFFDVHVIENRFVWNNITFTLVPTIHYKSNFMLMPTYGLFFILNGKKIWVSSDARLTPEEHQEYFEKADFIFYDCETQEENSHVHARYSELLTLPNEIKSKTWLYHYNPGKLPDAVKDGFLGFVKKGQVFEF